MPIESRAVAVVDALANKLELAILAGEYPPGTRIREARLANTFGVARGSMREAVRRLEGRKLLVRKPNLGTSVAIPTEAELRELMEVREALEVAVCRLAAERINDEQLAHLQHILLLQDEIRQVDDSSDILGRWRDIDFHYQLALTCGNKRLTDLLCGDILSLLRLYRYPGFLSPGIVPRHNADHRAIFNALAAHDPDKCEQAMRQHLGNSRNLLLSKERGSAAHPQPVSEA